MASENIFLLHALVMGIFITFVYDLFRILRRVFPHGRFMVALEDMIFWAYCAAEVFLLMYRMSDGKLRWFAVLGAMAGIFLYKKLISPWLVKYSALALGKGVGIIKRILHFLLRPFRFLFREIRDLARRAAVRAARGVIRQRQKMRRNLKKKLTYLLRVLKMTI